MGFTINMRKIKGADDLVKLALERRPWRDLEEIKEEAVRFLTSYTHHYLDRKVAYREAKKALRARETSQTNTDDKNRMSPTSDSTISPALPTAQDRRHSEVPDESR